MSQLHILQVTKSTAGVGQYTRWLVDALHTRFRLTVVCLSEGGPDLARDLSRYPGVTATSLAMERYRVSPLGDARVALQLREIIRGGTFDLIHAHASKPGFLARVAAAGSGLPVIYRPACFAFHDGVPRPRATLIAAIERLAARYLTDTIHCVCEGERSLALRWRVGRPEQLVAIRTGIDPAPFEQPADRAALRAELGVPPDAPLVGSVGRLDRQKAPLDFVRAAARVAAQRPDAHFVWVGEGTLEPQARALAAELGLGATLHFAGQRRDVPRLLRALDLFVLSAHWEGFALSVLEAMAAGLPVVSTRVMGADEAVVDGETGLLVPIGAPDALADAITHLIDAPEAARRLGAAGRERIGRLLTRERMMDQIAALYEAAAQRSATARRAARTVTP